MIHRHLLRALVVPLFSALLLGMCVATAEARSVPRVSGVAKAGQNWSQAKLTFRWNKVRNTRYYQVRFATSRARLAHGKLIASRVTRGTTPVSTVVLPTTSRCAPSAASARALGPTPRSRGSRSRG